MPNRAKTPIETVTPGDVGVQILDGVDPSKKAAVGSDGAVLARLLAGDGTPINDTSGASHIDIKEQTLPGLKLSRDSLAPTVSNPNYFAPVTTPTGGAAAEVSESNPLPVVLVPDPTPGTVVQGSLPVPVSDDPAYKEHLNIAALTSSNHDFLVPINSTFFLQDVMVSSLGSSTYKIVLDPDGTAETIDTIVLGTTGGSMVRDYKDRKEQPKIVTVGTTKKLRIIATNKERGQPIDMITSIGGRITP